MTSRSYEPAPGRAGDPASAGEFGVPALWRADPAHAVVSIVELRHAGRGCEFALHSSTVELDSRTVHTSLDLRVELEPVACARCGTMLFEGAADATMRWSAAHCVTAATGHPNLLVATGTLSLGSLGRPVELVGSAAVHRDELYLQITGTLPRGTLDTVPREDVGGASTSAASLTIIAQLHRRDG